ncbi:MAG: pyridoxamine 5'-phosphate oxidase family protein [Thermomicrobiales bacterium]
MTLPARTPEQRKQDTLDRLQRDVDCWVATADAGKSEPYLVPLSFLWDGLTLLIATATSSPTARNLLASRTVRLGLGLTRDVVLIEGRVRSFPSSQITQELGDAFAAKTGFDPRTLTSPYTYFTIIPQRIQAWREENELKGREIMSNGVWTVL